MRNLRCLFVITIIMVLPNISFAANHYIRSGSNGDGSSWSNALGDLPTSLERGDTYYVADGTYSGHTFSTPNSGTTKITIKKATVSDHGTDSGWSNSYGDGQALFNGCFSFESDYWVINGQVRNENDWTDGSSYGFKIYYTGKGIINSGLYESNYASNVEVGYVYIQGKDQNKPKRNDVFYLAWSGPNWHIHHNFVYDSNAVWVYLKGGSDRFVFEYNYFWKNRSYPTQHGEGFQTIGTAEDVILRYNVFREAQGTCVISVNSAKGWEIYGNVFLDNQNIAGNGTIGVGNSKYTTSNFKIYNNTFVNDRRCSFGRIYPVTNWEVKNNLFYNCSQNPSFGSGVSHSYNAAGGANDSLNETGAQTGLTSDIFLNYSGDNFRLESPTDAGTELSSHYYSMDMIGGTRGEDGNWDRGAFEYGSSTSSNGGGGSGGSGDDVATVQSPRNLRVVPGGGTTPTDDSAPPVISNLTPTGEITTIDPTTISIETNEASTCRADLSKSHFEDMLIPMTTTGNYHYVELTGINSNTTYTYYVRCRDSALNTTSATALTFFTN